MKTVHELSKNELDELRESYFCELQETDGDVLENIESANEIPIENVINHYDGIYFVEDDFFCNL